jgi:hypothetical protein
MQPEWGRSGQSLQQAEDRRCSNPDDRVEDGHELFLPIGGAAELAEVVAGDGGTDREADGDRE